MENKKKDSDIIKALEHCLYKDHKQSKCTECKYVTGCKPYLMREALDLINRQKEEIERLKEKNNGLALGLLYDVVNEDEELRKEIFEVAKSESITEYMEEVERRCIKRGIYPVIVKNILHNVKEDMVGENE